jgi:hypothetical protein
VDRARSNYFLINKRVNKQVNKQVNKHINKHINKHNAFTSVSSAVPKKGMAHPLAHRLLSSLPPLLGDSGTQSISGINL